MSADPDGDSQMLSSRSSSTDGQDRTSTPLNQPPTVLSPPDSQHRTMPPTAFANANGKRPINTISNGADDGSDDAELAGSSSGKGKAEFPTKTHEGSGYRWDRAEEEPGYAWLNKKAVDELHRAWDGLVHRECMVKGKYGDPFEVADKERAVVNSLRQQ